MIDSHDEVAIKIARKQILGRFKKRYQYNNHRFTPKFEVDVTEQSRVINRPGRTKTHTFMEHSSVLKVSVLINARDALIMRLINNDTRWTWKFTEELFEIGRDYYPDSAMQNLELYTSDDGTKVELIISEPFSTEEITPEDLVAKGYK